MLMSEFDAYTCVREKRFDRDMQALAKQSGFPRQL
jgi:hypothetical protein